MMEWKQTDFTFVTHDFHKLAIDLINWAACEGRVHELDYVCFFCGVTAPNPHRDYCLHKRAKEYRENHPTEKIDAHGFLEKI